MKERDGADGIDTWHAESSPVLDPGVSCLGSFYQANNMKLDARPDEDRLRGRKTIYTY